MSIQRRGVSVDNSQTTLGVADALDKKANALGNKRDNKISRKFEQQSENQDSRLEASAGEQGFSRRSFLKGGGITAGLIALAGGGLTLTACSGQQTAQQGSGANLAGDSLDGANNYEVYDTDVLVIGSGFGGFSAAFESVASGLKTTIVEKGPWGAGGVTGMNFDFLSAWITDPEKYRLDQSLTPLTNQQIFINSRIKNEENNAKNPAITGAGAQLDVITVNRGQCLPERNEDGTYHVFADIEAAAIRLAESTFPRHNLDQLHQTPDISCFDNTIMTDFIIQDGKCLGAMGIYLPTGTFRVFRAKSTVLATGGCCWINGWNTIAPASGSVPDNTSDLEMAAYRRGAAIVDAEFADYDLITVYPTGIACGYAAGLGADSYNVNYIKNKDGEAFLVDKDDPTKYMSSRTLFARTVALEIYNGKGSPNGGVYVDYASPESRATIRAFYKRNINLFKEIFAIDVSNEPLEVGFEMIEHQGNILVDDDAMSVDFKGLFATRGGTMSGPNGSPGAGKNQIYGTYAASKAVDYAKSYKAPDSFDWSIVNDEYLRLTNIRTKQDKSGLRPVTVRRAIQKAGGTCLGIIRGTAELLAAKAEIERIRREDLPRQAVTTSTLAYNTEWKEAIENYNLLDITEMTINATLLREESRGAYFRPDFPEKDDDNWACSLAFRKNGDGFATEKIQMPKVDWDSISWKSINPKA
jgi:succinate dehydrogenase / fumarate reductase flavoprotein subunit